MKRMTTKGHIIGCGAYKHKGKLKHCLAVTNLDVLQPKPKLAEMSFLGHGVSIDPTRTDHAAIFEKHGKGACYADLSAPKVLRRITTAKNRQFYGHGAFSPDGSLLYSVESVMDQDLKGVLIVRDGKTFKPLGEFPTFGTAPHDCLLLEGGATMVVTNGGGPIDSDDLPCISYVDAASEKLIERIELESPKFNTGHIAVTSAGDFAMISAPRDGLPNIKTQLGALSLKLKGEPIRTMGEPEQVVNGMLGETLSVAINESDDTVSCTSPEGNQVSMWNLKTGELLKHHRVFQEPRGVSITLDGKYYVISHKQNAMVCLSLISAETREHVPGFRVTPSFTSGSHIMTHDLAAAAAGQ